jgi:hypothetical protein
MYGYLPGVRAIECFVEIESGTMESLVRDKIWSIHCVEAETYLLLGAPDC